VSAPAPIAVEPGIAVSPAASSDDLCPQQLHRRGPPGAYVALRRQQLCQQTMATGQKYIPALWGEHAKTAAENWKELSPVKKQEFVQKYEALQEPPDTRPKKHLFGAAGAYMMECRQQLLAEAKAQGQNQTRQTFGQFAKEAGSRWKQLSGEEKEAYERKYQELHAQTPADDDEPAAKKHGTAWLS
jgi:hypothetical protein